MYSLVYAAQADKDLQAIYDFIAEDNPDRAGGFLREMEQQILRLREFPYIGVESRHEELKALGIRVLPYSGYLIFYIAKDKDKTVNIVRVLNGSINYSRLF